MGMNVILSPEQVEWAKQKRLERYSFQEIADALFVSYHTVTNAFIRHGISTKRPKQNLRYDFKKEA